MNVSPPSGDVTLMFTDIEGSTKAWDKYGEIYREALEIHHSLMRQAIAQFRGYEVKTIGDSFMVAFGKPLDAAQCAIEMQRLIENGPFEALDSMRVRIGLHTGMLEPYGGDYYGPVVNHTARIESAGHGGQTVLSEETARSIQSLLPEGANLDDCGLHRLKDLGAPIRLYLLKHGTLPQRDYPPLRTLDILPHNFPAQVTSFVGREKECAELTDLLLKQKARLITLSGPGGTGKTRLSMQVAADAVQHFKDGIWLVELAGVTDAREVPSALALALKIPLSSEKSVPDQVFAYLSEKKCLLVLDNFEQVVEAALFVSTLLQHCRDVVCLISSRHLLQVSGEVDYPLQPLELPPRKVTLETCFRYASVQLFVERAQAAKPQFVLNEEVLPAVTEICRRLEGLPLAVELTAALVRGMSPQQILPRLQDRFKLLASSRRDLDPRQRSLRGALDWSYELLSEDERALFAELSVFVGGFFIEDVEAVSTVCDCFMLTIALRDKSLLKTEEVQGEMRYFMLEMLRAYAGEKLADSDNPDEVKKSHGMHYLGRAQEWSAKLEISGDAMQRTITDIDNMRAGMDWAVQQQDVDTITSYGLALARFFISRGLYEEGDRRLSEAEEACHEKADRPALARILLQRGRIAEQSARLDDAKALFTESLEISRSLQDDARILPPLINLGNIAWFQSDFETARKLWQESLELAVSINHPHQASLLSSLSILSREQGRFEEALRYIEQSLELHCRNGYQMGMAFALWNYGETVRQLGQLEQAVQKLEESRSVFDEIGYKLGTAMVCFALSQTHLELGATAEAEQRAEDGLRIARDIGDRRCEMLAMDAMGRISARQGNLELARSQFLSSAEIGLELNDNGQVAQALFHYGEMLLNNHREAEAYPLIAAAHREYAARGLYQARVVGEILDRLKQTLQDELPELLEQEAARSAISLSDLVQCLKQPCGV